MNTNQPAVYDPLTRTLHWLTVAGFIGIPTTIVLWNRFRRHFVWQDWWINKNQGQGGCRQYK
ncbi:putative cytochrome B561 [Neisseria meningitidis]|nr:hypothetical protein [Neisseria meningitidis]CKL17127.1 putative cytochrome B561 [Neisseria meningitidis]